MSVLAETYTLSNGDRIPKIGFGTWLLREGD
jgi:diketogulonate reductase-like aldo/keto reductase